MLAFLGGCGYGQPAFVDLATLERSSSPNSYLVCPADRTRARVDQEAPVYAVDAETLWSAWLDLLAEAPRLEPLARDDAARRYLAVQRTAVFRFPDIVQVEILAVPPDRSTLCLYSRSVYGYSDLGMNRRRVEGWLAGLDVPLAQ